MEWFSRVTQFFVDSDRMWMLYSFSIVFVTLILSFLESKYYYKFHFMPEKYI